MPFFGDQPVNAQHIVNKGLGAQVRRAEPKPVDKWATGVVCTLHQFAWRCLAMQTPSSSTREGARRAGTVAVVGTVSEGVDHAPASLKLPPQVDPWTLTAAKLTRAIEAQLADREAARRVAELGARLRRQSGAQRAAELLERFGRQ
jgi:hypothetical protein